VPCLPLFSFSILLRSSVSEVFFIHDIIAVKHRPCLPVANLHNGFFVHAKTPQIPAPSSPEIVYQQTDVVQVSTAALTVVSGHSSITDATCHPAKPNIAAHLVPSFPKIADGLSIFTCEHAAFRSLTFNAHRDDYVDFPRHLNDSGHLCFASHPDSNR
jgi:hypothetical protein